MEVVWIFVLNYYLIEYILEELVLFRCSNKTNLQCWNWKSISEFSWILFFCETLL